MANAVVARWQGDDYQARHFWLRAVLLFHPESRVVRVGFEVDAAKAFDDVAVLYSPGHKDERGDSVDADYHQVKFHTNQGGAFTWAALMDPEFINATRFSLLQRLRDARHGDAERRHRFHIESPWPVHPDDALSELVGNAGGALNLDRLRDGKTERSRMAKVRIAWREHLELDDEEELFDILGVLRIHPNRPSLTQLTAQLNTELRGAGLAPADPALAIHPYDELIPKLRQRGRSLFSRDEMEEVLREHGLWRGGPRPLVHRSTVGVRSFTGGAENMEQEVDRFLCIAEHFDGRYIREPELWETKVHPELDALCQEVTQDRGPRRLHLSAHSSLAFAMGYALDPKAGIDIDVVQQTRAGSAAWAVTPGRASNRPPFEFGEVNLGTGGGQTALAVSVTRPVVADVEEYVRTHLPAVGRIIAATVTPRPGQTAVVDGDHAHQLAEEIAWHLKEVRTRAQLRAGLHLFAAAPNGFMFFLGQLAHDFGPCQLYEYDFGGNSEDAYRPSVSFPRVAAATIASTPH
jgi:hypothetical protein